MVKVFMQSKLININLITGSAGIVANIILNRPQAYNALNLEMLRIIKNKLHEFAIDPKIIAVCIQANGERAFCAGGDLKEVYYMQDRHLAKQYFYEEYRLNYLIKHYPKPYIALTHGIVMGGGVGLVQYAWLRLSDPDLIWAMPETGIGFYPDVGATYFLNRCPNNLGMFLALTGTSLNLADCLLYGYIDAPLPRHTFPEFIINIANAGIPNKINLLNYLNNKYTCLLEPSNLNMLKTTINQIFTYDTLKSIITKLKNRTDLWSQNIYLNLLKKSPLSLAVTHTALQIARPFSFSQCLNLEYALSCKFLNEPNFYEGIRATLIDKDKQPSWKPKSIEQLNWQNIASFFTKAPVALDLPV